MSIPKMKLLIINDNHFIRDAEYKYKGSKFHLFTKGFINSEVFLSSPIYSKKATEERITIDGVNVLPRIGYKSALYFYKTIILYFLKHYHDLKKHIRNSDVILLVSPACTLPISYLICRTLNKPVALYIVGDVVEVTNKTSSPNFIFRHLRNITSRWEWFITSFISKRHTTFVLGSSMQKKLNKNSYKLINAMTSLVTRDSIIPPCNNIYSGKINLLTVSRLSKEKAIHNVLQTIASFGNKIDFLYTIVGEGPEIDNLKQLVTELDIDRSVNFAGYLEPPEIRECYLGADIFILPSLSEGLPKVILDAMATATPIISTNVGGIPDLLSVDQSRGWLVEPNNIEELKSAIFNCITQDKVRYTKVLNANEYIKQHTLEKEVDRIESELEELLSD